MQIGGLDSKLEGGWKAGCKKAVVPRENEDDVKQIMKRRKDNGEPEEWIEVVMVDNINEVLDLMLEENDITFNKI
jgi:predicted ATP-dependent protease